jgi:hypothetical protein
MQAALSSISFRQYPGDPLHRISRLAALLKRLLRFLHMLNCNMPVALFAPSEPNK